MFSGAGTSCADAGVAEPGSGYADSRAAKTGGRSKGNKMPQLSVPGPGLSAPRLAGSVQTWVGDVAVGAGSQRVGVHGAPKYGQAHVGNVGRRQGM